MPVYEAPGVYYERVDARTPSIAAIRTDTESVAADIDSVEQGFGRVSKQIEQFSLATDTFVTRLAS